MKVVNTADLIGTPRDIDCPRGAFKSLRILLESDGMGYTLTETHIKNGGPYNWHYKNHLESCYCLSGVGEVRDVETNNVFEVSPGVTYILDKHDNHELTAFTDMILLCVFNPPLKGSEVHKNDNSY